MKDAVICFRISKELRNVLESISKADRRSLSATIENILHTYAEERGAKLLKEDRRVAPRKKLSVPALVSNPDGTVHGGMIQDISAGGLRVTVPEEDTCDLSGDSKISVVFALPESDRPLTMKCVPRYVHSNGQKSIGASFVEEECDGHETLTSHLKR